MMSNNHTMDSIEQSRLASRKIVRVPRGMSAMEFPAPLTPRADWDPPLIPDDDGLLVTIYFPPAGYFVHMGTVYAWEGAQVPWCVG